MVTPFRCVYILLFSILVCFATIAELSFYVNHFSMLVLLAVFELYYLLIMIAGNTTSGVL